MRILYFFQTKKEADNNTTIFGFVSKEAEASKGLDQDQLQPFQNEFLSFLKLFLTLIISIITITFSLAQESGIQPFQSINPSNEDFADLQFLKTEIGGKRIVIIGEQDHFAGASIDAKARVTNFLIKEMGFEVLLFEAGFYDVKKSIEYAKNNNNNRAIPASLYFFWGKSINITPFLNSISNDAMLGKLFIDGVDPKFTSVFAKNYVTDLELEMEKIGFKYENQAEWTQFKFIIQNVAKKFDKQIVSLSQEEKRLLNKVAGELVTVFSEKNNGYWAQLIKTNTAIIIEYANVTLKDMISGNEKSKILDSNRDSIMAENARWLLENKYKDKKIIIWAASYHIIKTPEILSTQTDKNSFSNKKILGNEVSNLFPSETYSIGFISYQGKFGISFDKPKGKKINTHTTSSLEHYVSNFKYLYCFLSLSKMDNINKMTASINGFNNGYSSTDWSKNFDGIIYIETMYPNVLK